jgi:lipocalin-like protein
MRSVALLVAGLTVLLWRVPAHAGPTAEPPPRRILGTWKLLSYVREDAATGLRSDVMGPHPSGYINYAADGRMMVIIVGSERHKPAAAVATPGEAAALLSSMLAYAGTYTLDTQAGTVTHHIEVSWDETRTGESHVRSYRFEAQRLVLTTQPSRDPATGQPSVRTLTWEHVK